MAPLLAVAALVGGALPASAATGPYGFTILDADSGNMAHNCEILGSDTDPGYVTDGSDVYQAVVCVDILTGETSDGYYAEGRVEAYCQTPAGVTVSCGDISLFGLYSNADASSGDNVQTNGWGCNGTYGNCPAIRNVLPIYTFTYTGGVDCDTSSGHQVWDEALGDTSIGIPGGDAFSVESSGANDGTSYSTGHYWICP